MKGFSKSSSVTPQAFNSARWGARSKPFFMASLRIVTLPRPSLNVTARPKTFFFSYRTPSAVFRGPYMGLVNMLRENLRIALSDLKKSDSSLSPKRTENLDGDRRRKGEFRSHKGE
jgi:hypothetical protein